jgi:hypothetical protein
MAGKYDNRNAVAVSDLADAILDPVLRKRAGMSVALVQSWEEIVGPRLAATSRPERIRWPRRAQDEGAFEPAVLVVACSGVAALHLQHETAEVIGRVNAFLGYNAIGRIRIEQKPVADIRHKRPQAGRALSPAEQAELGRAVGGIDDEGLRASLARLGASILGRR